MSGDDLTVFVGLATAVLTCGVTALISPKGWQAKTLWGLTVVFLAATVGWVVAPAASPFVQLVRPYVTAFVQSGAFVMVATVSVVAIISSKGRRVEIATAGDNAKLAGRAARKAIDALSHARSSAAYAIDLKDNWEGEKTRNIMRAALITAGKQFDLPEVPETGEIWFDLTVRMRLIDQVMPFLEAGHIEEARGEAQRVADTVKKVSAPED